MTDLVVLAYVLALVSFAQPHGLSFAGMKSSFKKRPVWMTVGLVVYLVTLARVLSTLDSLGFAWRFWWRTEPSVFFFAARPDLRQVPGARLNGRYLP